MTFKSHKQNKLIHKQFDIKKFITMDSDIPYEAKLKIFEYRKKLLSWRTILKRVNRKYKRKCLKKFSYSTLFKWYDSMVDEKKYQEKKEKERLKLKADRKKAREAWQQQQEQNESTSQQYPQQQPIFKNEPICFEIIGKTVYRVLGKKKSAEWMATESDADSLLSGSKVESLEIAPLTSMEKRRIEYVNNSASPPKQFKYSRINGTNDDVPNFVDIPNEYEYDETETEWSNKRIIDNLKMTSAKITNMKSALKQKSNSMSQQPVDAMAENQLQLNTP